MFNKRVKSKPQRVRDPSPVDDIAEISQDSPLTTAKQLKVKAGRKKPKSRLSFVGDEEEGEENTGAFQLKKSKLSRKMAVGSIPQNLDQATISPSRPTYDQAYLNELKASTPSARAPAPATDPSDIDISGGTAVGTTDAFENLETFIPSESSIKTARERRERIRTSATGTDDYISLSVSKYEDQGPHPESRLVREEDELGEADDEFAEYTSAQERVALSKQSRKVEASQRREKMKEMIAEADEDDEDEETAEWEQEQSRRGGHFIKDLPQVKEQTYKPAPIPPVTPIPTLSASLARLTRQMAQLTTSHAHNTAALNSLALEREQVDEREKELRELVGKAEEKRAWFGSFSEWVEGVAGFLDEKYPMLEKLEEEHVSLLQERFVMVNKRRRQDEDDDLSTLLGPLPVQTEKDDLKEETDELGRTIPKLDPAVEKRLRRAARLARRQRRLQMRQKENEEEGFSTDSEIPSHDEDAYRSAVRSLRTRTKDVLADVKAKEFLDPGKGQWIAWREKYADSYFSAWGGLGVVSVWEFWARLESLGWDPIEEPKNLDTFRWYQGLHEYCRPGDPVDETRVIGDDGDLVSSMITTAIIPRLGKVIESGALDVYSRQHIKRMIDLEEEIEATVEHGSPKLQILPKVVAACFETVISEIEEQLSRYTSTASARPTPPFDPESVPSRQRYLTRQLKLLTNLLKWRKSTGERFGLGRSVTRLVDNVIIIVADSGWEVGGADVVQTVSGMLPPDLTPVGIKSRLNRR
ncbi:hypothetical protein E1B28_000767 [Marasmius oreades]|uniref:Uncharacterized protein n=1 Tax=Marasmius oreades TaxID=181124 RepID=A0A9P8AEQ7_9AGAR|nr:uncharacterized protein E1B28_000767 [Marasmius oreades]KAG7098864.1 hypothetical protein E1B28_000767 [Marasmius oreades]